jgi:hypothetical protein
MAVQNLSRRSPRSIAINNRLRAYRSPSPLSSPEDEPPTLVAILSFPQNLVEQPKAAKGRRAKRPEKFTIAEAFSYNTEPSDGDSYDFHLERAIRSVAYLLELSTEVGNDPVDGFAAYGLSRILQYCADRVRP